VPAAQRAQIRTVRDLIDDRPAWDEFTALVIDTGVIGTDTRIAQLLSAHLDRPIADLPAGVWTKGWPPSAFITRVGAFVDALNVPTEGIA